MDHKPVRGLCPTMEWVGRDAVELSNISTLRRFTCSEGQPYLHLVPALDGKVCDASNRGLFGERSPALEQGKGDTFTVGVEELDLDRSQLAVCSTEPLLIEVANRAYVTSGRPGGPGTDWGPRHEGR